MATDKKNYRDTVHLPKTDFPMKADLPNSEPKRLEVWKESGLHQKIQAETKGRPLFVLHDGPPYANGHIHIGHAFNKILKDIIVKYKTMGGFRTPYIPGWDCHGLPIEHALLKEMNKRKDEVSQVEFRKKARNYAEKFVNIQREEFKRLGIFGLWDEPYLTMNAGYQATIAECFLELFEKGFIEQRMKPVPWCFDCETALADAELEYQDKISDSVFVSFEILPQSVSSLWKDQAGQKVSLLVWTTTPWTLPANVAVAFNPSFDYALIRTEQGLFVCAASLIDVLKQKIAFSEAAVLSTFSGKKLERLQAKHPFVEGRISQGVLAQYVSDQDGTGIVHIAPGHGEEDYLVGLEYGLDVLSPVDAKGRFTNEFLPAEGILVHKANQKIIDILKQKNALLLQEPFSHSYPHCWRCKSAILFRATQQWFLKVDHRGLRQQLISAIQQNIQFTPDWGKNRIGGMIESRPDWCLSRQRYWGVPIPIIRCRNCKVILVKDSKQKIVEEIREKSADVWFQNPAAFFLPEGFQCVCGNRDFEKEVDIIDVWFDSGISHQAVLKKRKELRYPADLYLEGSDQHRGWFQTALITGVALEEVPPFQSVLTHGFVVDGEGKKMSKSAGNVVAPQEVMKQFGADLLRLWVASSDYQFDVRLSNEILKRLTEAYRRIRNTFRFLLGNLHDFDPELQKVDFDQMASLDKWAIGKSFRLVESITQNYEHFVFHQIYRLVQDYLVSDLSSFYLDVLKDRLYTFGKNSPQRRSAQTALYLLLKNLVKLLAPILPFTCDEAWQYFPIEKKVSSVHLAHWPQPEPALIDEQLILDWQDLLAVRDELNRMIELKREAKEIGSSLEIQVVLFSKDEKLKKLFEHYLKDFRDAMIVSQLSVGPALGENKVSIKFPSDGVVRELSVEIKKAEGTKCERCWHYDTQVGQSPEHPLLCPRCIAAISECY